MNIHDPPENASLISAIEGKCLIIHIIKFRFNISLVRRVNLLCNGEGKEASVKVLVLVLDLPFPQFWIYYIMGTFYR